MTETLLNTTTQMLNTYLVGPFGVFAVVTMAGDEAYHYVLKDNLGSWVAITDKNGAVEQQLSYDAWGNLRNPNNWANYTLNDIIEKPMFDRGFTGHEHLCHFSLINMNGRMYDPVTSSFLSADRYVQDPTSAMGFNRYAYCMYNPLRFVDPTGWLSGGGGNGNGDHPPGELYYVNGMPTVNLPEVTIWPDTPNLSNTYEYEEFEFTPNITSGGFDNVQGNSNSWASGRHSRGSGGGNGNHGGCSNTTTNPNVNVEIASKLLIPANLYTIIMATSYFNEFTLQWQDKLGVMRDFDFYGNQYVGGKKSFGKAMSNKYLRVSKWINVVGIGLSGMELASATSIDEQIKYSSDILVGVIGFAPGGAIISTFWFLGGRELVFRNGEIMGTMIKQGLNPGLMEYQPFK